MTGLETNSYFVVSATGEPMGSLSFPRANRLLAVSRSHALVVEVDELGVHAIASYPIPDRSLTLR